MSVRRNLISKVFGLFGVLALTVGGTTVVLNTLKHDGLLINLAGRQRMLSQRMTKDAFAADRAFATAKQQRTLAEWKATVAIFDQTLLALHKGGQVVDGAGQVAIIQPVPDPQARAALELGIGQWQVVEPMIQKALRTSAREDLIAAVTALEEANLTLMNSMNTATTSLQEASDAKVRWLYGLQGAAFGISLLLLAWIYTSLQRQVLEPLALAVSFAERVASGQFGEVLPPGAPDEVGRLSAALSTLSVQSARSIREILETSQRFTSFVRQLDSTAGNLDASSDLSAQQSGRIQRDALKMVEAMASLTDALHLATGEMEQATNQAATVGRSIASVKSSVESISEDTQSASLSFHDMATGLHDVSHDTASVTEATADAVAKAISHIESLGDAMQVVTNVLVLIKDLAEQIQFLSLNASIEAAAAGEAGKGFAVVAHEIKGLSLQTHNATKNIEVKLTGMEASLERATAVIRALTGHVESLKRTIGELGSAISHQSNTVGEANSRLAQTANSVYRVNQSVADVTTAAQGIGAVLDTAGERLARLDRERGQLNSAIQQVQSGSSQIDDAAKSAARQAKVIAELSSHLTATAAALQSSVAGYQIREGQRVE